MADIIQLRGGTAAAWAAANPILAEKEIGVETNTRKMKMGDGLTAWNALQYLATTIEDVTIDINGDMIVTLSDGQQINAGNIPAGPAGPQGPAGADGAQGPQGPQGPAGADGPQGPQGPQGPAGADGADGTDGASAYEVAVANGFVGTEAAWLLSLQGDDGAQGPQGIQGPAGADGAQGPQGPQGPAGADGTDGASAYEVAVANGFVGTEAAWLLSLQGADGAQGPQGPAGADGPQGPQGPQGPAGADGADGADATADTVGAIIAGATAKGTPADADSFGLSDSAAGGVLKKLTWVNLRTAIKSYLDTVTTTLTNKYLVNPNIQNFVEEPFTPTVTAGAVTISLGNGTFQKVVTAANTTITLPTAVGGKSFTILVQYGGNHTITWAGGTAIRWPGGTAPTATSVSGKTDIYTFTSHDNSFTLGGDGGRNYTYA